MAHSLLNPHADKTAVDFAYLVGKYVSMARTPDEVEGLEAKASGYDLNNYSIGGDGIVHMVKDSFNRVGGHAIEIIFDYGMGWPVFSDPDNPHNDWRFSVFNSLEDTEGWTHNLQR